MWHEVQAQVKPAVGASFLDNQQQVGVWLWVPSEESYADVHNLPRRENRENGFRFNVPPLLVKHEPRSIPYCMKILKLNTGLSKSKARFLTCNL